MRLMHQSENLKVRFELRPGVNVLGRSQACDVIVDDPVVSSRHCEVVVEENRVIVRDLESTNGTYVNNIPILESELRVGDRLVLGTFELELEPIPKISIPPLPSPEHRRETLSDGKPCCFQHPDAAAHARCTGCQRYFCLECIHHVRRLGGTDFLHFCPICGQPCDMMAVVEIAVPKPRSFLGGLQETIRMAFKNRKT